MARPGAGDHPVRATPGARRRRGRRGGHRLHRSGDRRGAESGRVAGPGGWRGPGGAGRGALAGPRVRTGRRAPGPRRDPPGNRRWSVTRTVSIADGGAGPAREALEDCVRGGGVAVFPADTLYGLGCDPSSGEAIARINSLKGRDEAKPSAVMFFAPLAMRELLSTLGPRTREALGTLLPGAVTLVVHNPQSLYPLAGPEHPDRLGIRLIEGSLAGAASPLLQTSANRSGEQAPSRFDQVDSRILDGADLAID